MRKLIFTLTSLLCLNAVFAQRLADSWKPVPEAVSDKAPMPADMAEKFARLEQERALKYLTSPMLAVPAVDREVLQKKSNHLVAEDGKYQIRRNPGGEYMIWLPTLRLVNSSHGREHIKGNAGKFNPKKDRISYAVVQEKNKICIVNHDHKLVDMSEFRLSCEDDNIVIDGNAITFKAPIHTIAAGEYPWLYKIKCEHLLSDAKYTFDLQLVWPKSANLSGQLRSFSLTPLKSTAADNLGMLCDLDARRFMVVQLPFLIEADGVHGADGRNGHTGAAGTNQRTWKDKEGNTHTVNGTCGKPGEDGTDGQDGTDGGRFLICVSPDLVAMYGLEGMVITIDAGLGGKGGKGGAGGKHGTGSGCSGKAADGKDGRDGKDGKRGDFLYVLADVDAFNNQIFK